MIYDPIWLVPARRGPSISGRCEPKSSVRSPKDNPDKIGTDSQTEPSSAGFSTIPAVGGPTLTFYRLSVRIVVSL